MYIKGRKVMKRRIILILSTLFCLNVLVAVPFGTLGNINVPDGFVIPANQISVNFASYLRDEPAEDVVGSQDYEYNYVVQARFGIFDRAEVGFVYTGDEIFYANAKYQLVRESYQYPGITIGVDNIFSKVGPDYQDTNHKDYSDWEDIQDASEYERNSFYISANKSWAFRDVALLGDMQLYLTFGVGTNRFVGQRDRAKDLGGLFATAEYYPTALFPRNNFSIFAETSQADINAGAKFTWRGLAIQYSVLQLDEFIKDNQENLKMALNVQYNITNWVQTNVNRRGMFESSQYKVRVREQMYESTTEPVLGSDLLEQIRALRAEEAKRQAELDELIEELEELE